MKIERIELLLLELPYVHFFETSLGREEKRTFILVKIFGNGLCGYGEVVAEKSPLYSYESTSTAWLVLKEYLIPLVWQESIDNPKDFSQAAGRYKGHPMAKAGLELAFWDLKAKSQNLPLWKIYGGNKKEIPVGVSVGIQDSVRQLLERIEAFLREGYQRIKIKIKPGWDVRICQEIRRRFPDILLQVDANGAYSLSNKELLKELDAFHLLMLEQPFPPYDLWDHSKLQRQIETAICLDESIVSAETARQAHEMGSCRIINIKVGRVGGIVEARKIHDFCQQKSMPVWCGGMLESGIGRAHNIHLATLPNFRFPHDLSASKRYYAQDLIE
ncbi:MAG: o-succinylbenzoate synthase, partial [Candidatus Aminicenantales bacterium]